MITPSYCQMMARYNAWQNQSLFKAAVGLSDAEREADRGAFFGGIRATLSHLMWADLIWIARFEGVRGRTAPSPPHPRAMIGRRFGPNAPSLMRASRLGLGW